MEDVGQPVNSELFTDTDSNQLLEDTKNRLRMLRGQFEALDSENDTYNDASEDQAERQDSYDSMEEALATSATEEENSLSSRRTFMCKLCNKEYSYSYRRRHMAIHKGVKSYQCNECDKSFYDKCNLKSHMRVHYESVGPKDFCCEICGKKFTQKVYLKKHMVLHTGKRQHQCSLCDKAYNRRADLNTHMLVHEGRNFECDICGKRYVCKKQLKDHIKVHRGLKEYECKVCGKGFSISSGLRSHMAVHDNEGKHVCEICGKTCKRKSNLQDHMLTHSDIKEFKCPMCGKEFARRMGMRKHMVLHTKAEVQMTEASPVVDPLFIKVEAGVKVEMPTFNDADDSPPHFMNVEVDCIIKEEKDAVEQMNSNSGLSVGELEEENNSREESDF